MQSIFYDNLTTETQFFTVSSSLDSNFYVLGPRFDVQARSRVRPCEITNCVCAQRKRNKMEANRSRMKKFSDSSIRVLFTAGISGPVGENHSFFCVQLQLNAFFYWIAYYFHLVFYCDFFISPLIFTFNVCIWLLCLWPCKPATDTFSVL